MKRTLLRYSKFISGIAGVSVFLLLMFFAFFYFVFVNPFNTLERNDIFTLVTENRVYLEAYIEHGDFLELLEIDEIQSVRSFGDTIEFACGGSGLGSATFYCGFYYSENDDLYGIWCAPTEGSSLTPVDGGFLYEEAKGDNRYYTEHICGHFYYYEAAF